MTNWKTVRLELSQSGEFPFGSVSRGYHICLPLDDTDQVDEAAFMQSPFKGRIRRFWSTDKDEAGRLLRSGFEWIISCGDTPSRILKLGGEPVRLGRHLLVIEPDGTTLLFRVASIR